MNIEDAKRDEERSANEGVNLIIVTWSERERKERSYSEGRVRKTGGSDGMIFGVGVM